MYFLYSLKYCFFNVLGVDGQLDVIYAVDGSRRVDSNVFNKMREFVLTSLKSFVISRSAANVGIVQYGEKAEILITPRQGTSLPKLNDVAQKLSRVGGVRRMDKALKLVNSEIIGKASETRPGSKKVLILLTTGKNSGDGSGELPRVVRMLRDEGVDIIAVVVGKNADPSEVEAIIGRRGSLVSVESPNNLKDAVGQLEDKIKDLKGMK